LNKDTVHLLVAKDPLEKDTYFKIYPSADSNLSITVFAAFAGKDQKSFGEQVTVNDTTRVELDLDGHTSIKKTHVNTVKVNLAMNEMLRDSIFRINSNDNNIEIHTSVIPLMEVWIPKVYLRKGKKIYPLQFEPEMVSLGKNDNYKKR
jgi:hypothetical protein